MAVFSVNNSNDRFTLKLTLTEGAYDVANNTSPVTYKLQLIANTSYNFEKYGIGRTIVLGGKTVYSGAKKSGEFSIADYGTLTLASGTTTIQHDDDGSKKLSVKYSITMTSASYTPGDLSGSGTMTLANIPRSASLLTIPNFTDEQNPTITYTNPAGSAVTSLEACISLDVFPSSAAHDDIAYRAVPKTGSSYTFELTEAERDVLRNACATSNSRTVMIVLRTVIGGKTYETGGTATLSIVNANPAYMPYGLSYKDTNAAVTAITGNDQYIVQNKSLLAVNFWAFEARKGATIEKCEINVNGTIKSVANGGTFDMGVVNSSQDVDIIVTGTDSRGNSASLTKKVTMLAYSPPVVSVTLERQNNYEDETYLTVDATISSVKEKNTLALSYKKAQSGGSYGAATALTNKVKHTTTCDKNYAYVFSITVADAFETVTKELTLPKGRFPLFIDTEKNAVGVNEFPGEGEALRVAGGVACFDDGIVLKTATKAYKITINDSGTLVITELK